MADFAPGPWKVDREKGKIGILPDSRGGEVFCVAEADSRKIVCIVGIVADDGLDDTRKANAELIAQAPTLLAENIRLRRELEQSQEWADAALYVLMEHNPEKSSDPLVSKEQLRDIALAVHDTVHGQAAEPLEVGQIMVALMQLRNIYEAKRRGEDGPNQQA
jgi:hypothetical protein